MSDDQNQKQGGQQQDPQDGLEQNKDVQEQTQQQEQPRYVDPNSGAAPQPGGFVAAPVAEDQPAPQTLGDPEADPVLAASRETQAAPAGEQPSDDSQTNAAEDGTTEGGEEKSGGGSQSQAAESQDGQSQGGESEQSGSKAKTSKSKGK